MTQDTTFILGLFLGVSLCILCLLFFRDIIIKRMFSVLIPVGPDKKDKLDELQEAIEHDIKIDLQILLDNKKTVETLLSLQVDLCDADKESLNNILSLLNERVSQATDSGWIIDNNLKED